MECVEDLSGKVDILSYRPVFKGPYSTVYRGKLKDGGKIVAIKVLNAIQDTALHTIRRKIARERTTWSLLQHPNILPLYGFADDDEHFQPFGAFISPWCHRGDMAQYVQEQASSAPLNERLKLWKGVVAGVAYLHTRNPVIIHGDLKPRNILIDNHGKTQLCDFGLARVLLEEGHSGMTTTTAHTGTLRYLAYELVTEEEPIPTMDSDIYATGCIGLEIIFVTTPYSDHVHLRPAGRPTSHLLFLDYGRLHHGVGPVNRCLEDIARSIDPEWQQASEIEAKDASLQTSISDVKESAGLNSKSSAKTAKTEATLSLTSTSEPLAQKNPRIPISLPPELLVPAPTGYSSSSRVKGAPSELTRTRTSQRRRRPPSPPTRNSQEHPPAYHDIRTTNPDTTVNHRFVPVFVTGRSAPRPVASLATPYSPVKQPPNATVTQPMSPTLTVSAAASEAETRSRNIRPTSTGDGYLQPIQRLSKWLFGDDQGHLNSGRRQGYSPSSTFTPATPPSFHTTTSSSKTTLQSQSPETKSREDKHAVEILSNFSHANPDYEIEYSFSQEGEDHDMTWVCIYKMERRIIGTGDRMSSRRDARMSAAREALSTLESRGYDIMLRKTSSPSGNSGRRAISLYDQSQSNDILTLSSTPNYGPFNRTTQ